MRTRITALAVMVLVAGFASSGWSQRGVVDRTGSGAYEDISKRETRSTEREERKKREAEAARKKAEEEKRREERRRRSDSDDDKRKEPAKGMTTTAAGGGKENNTTDSKAAAAGRRGGPKGAASATQPSTAGGSTDPTSQEVNEVILNSVKTRQVEFNLEAAKKNPKIIILNEPKFRPEERMRAGDTGMARPL